MSNLSKSQTEAGALAGETVTVPAAKYYALVAFCDQQLGTPCAQIRWQDRECALLAHIAGNGSMSDERIDEMSAEQMRDLFKYIARDGRRLAGFDTAERCAEWVDDYGSGRI
jgi:hypothetical protein